MGMLDLDLKLNERVFGLDVMRAVAIGLVLLLNGDPLLRRNFPAFPQFWFVDGVDVFFVLSGFLIGRILITTFEKNGIRFSTLLHFWKFRWFRTLPNYYLILFITMLFVYSRDGGIGAMDWRYFLFLQNLTEPIPDFFTVSWSLVVEEWFYLTFPLVTYLMSKAIPGLSARGGVLATTLLFLLLPLILRVSMVLNNVPFSELANISNFLEYEKQIRSVGIFRMDTIAFGVLGSYLSHFHYVVWHRYRFQAFLTGLAVYLLFRAFLDDGWGKFTLLFTVCGFALFLLLPLASSIRSGHRSIASPITHLSLISYSAYLIHRSLVVDAFRHFGGRPFTDTQAVAYYLLYFVVTIVLSTFLYRYFELPAMQLRERRYFLPFRKVPVPGISSTDLKSTSVRSLRKEPLQE
jgi:peptidoglycan/LPS O-acetylase OafA/YrhL